MTRPSDGQQKNKRTNLTVDLADPVDHLIKLKESEKIDMYLDIVRQQKKKLWDIKVTVIPIVIGALGTVTKDLLQVLEDSEIRERMETIQPTAFFISAIILRRVLETCRDLQKLALSQTPVKDEQLNLV